MKIFVNGASIKEGGSRVVLTKLISEMRSLRPSVQWALAAPPDILSDIGNEQIYPVPLTLGSDSLASVVYWYQWKLPGMLREWRADALFSLTNYLPVGRVSCPTLLLEQHAGHFSPEFNDQVRQSMPSLTSQLSWRLKQNWVFSSVRSATRLTVQTSALADAIAHSGIRSRADISVIPHGPGWVGCAPALPAREPREKITVGYITKWGVQKNFSTLFEAVRVLEEKGNPVNLVLTLAAGYGPAAQTLELAARMGISHRITNHGEVTPDRLPDLYDQLDALIFPSTCESFGMPMVEAMARGIPVIAADTPVNREITGVAGLFFPAYDQEGLASLIERHVMDAAARNRAAQASLLRADDFSWRAAAEATLDLLEQTVRANG